MIAAHSSSTDSSVPVPSDRPAVFFDAVHTLFDLEPNYAGAFARVAHDFGHPATVQAVEAALAPLLEALDRRKRSDISHACTHESLAAEWIEFNVAVFRALGVDGDAHRLSLEVERRFDAGTYAAVYPEAREALRAVRARGVFTGIISNGTAGMENCLRVLGLTAEVDRVVVSALAGFEKPATAIFRQAEALAGAAPGRCLMIGDNYWADVAGARAAGWEAVWLNPKGKPAPERCLEIAGLDEAVAEVDRWLARLAE